MKFKLNIDMDNAAFDECPEEELQDLLERVKQRLAGGVTEGKIVDINGNMVGKFEITD